MEHCQAAVLRIGIGPLANAAAAAVEIQPAVAPVLGKGNLGRDATGRRAEEFMDLGILRARYVPAVDGLAEDFSCTVGTLRCSRPARSS